jgi:hypothetical protein
MFTQLTCVISLQMYEENVPNVYFMFFKSVHSGLLFLVFFPWQGLTLFNFDMIRKGGSGNCYYVIDINYFPGM